MPKQHSHRSARGMLLAVGVALVSSVALGKEVRLENYRPIHAFAHYPARVGKLRKYHEPVLASRHARYYQTEIRNQAREGPDFAGHVKVAAWGCGTCCHQLAFIDLQNGKLWFPDFGVTCGSMPDGAAEESWAFDITHGAGEDYKIDSNLFVVYGTKNEANCSGVYYFVWRKDRLEPLGKDREICSKPHA